jgi:hypothetical protein
MFELPGEPLALFVSRGDRAARSAEFAAAFGRDPHRFSRIVVWGERTPAMARRMRSRGVPPGQILDAGSRSPDELTELLTSNMGGNRTVVGVGNIVGPAQQWLAHLAEHVA